MNPSSRRAASWEEGLALGVVVLLHWTMKCLPDFSSCPNVCDYAVGKRSLIVVPILLQYPGQTRKAIKHRVHMYLCHSTSCCCFSCVFVADFVCKNANVFLFLSNQEQTSLYMNWYEEDNWSLAVVWGQWKCVCVCVCLFRRRHGMLQEMNWKSWWSSKSFMGTLQFGSWVQWLLRRLSRSHGTWVSYCEFVVILSSLLLLIICCRITLGVLFPLQCCILCFGLMCVCVCTHMRVSKFCTFFSVWLCVWVGFDWQRNRSVGEWHFSALEITFQHLWGAAKEIGLFETKFQWWGIF